ncbi:MAG: serine/threonine protein kinase, partial [Actinobacteria bacterium]
MAVVYLARDRELERPVALKLLAENLAGDGDFRKRFVREARLAARLSHPNVVQVYDAGEDD